MEIIFISSLAQWSAESIFGYRSQMIIDSGASDHMTPNLACFIDPVPLSHTHKINMPTGDTTHISHIDSVAVLPELVLRNVLCVPNFQHNLLSVQRLIKDSNCEVQFLSCHIVDRLTKQIVGKGELKSGLYYLVPHNTVTSSSTCMTATSQVTPNTSVLWHNRLGHCPIPKLHLIPSIKPHLTTTNSVCMTCHMPRFTKLPFSPSLTCATSIFELIHMDIWGPYKVPYQNKYRYFLTIVDDFSRHTWIYLLHQKYDALNNFKAFYEYAQTHFNSSIKFLRTDNALEFSDSSCNQFFDSHSILHQKIVSL